MSYSEFKSKIDNDLKKYQLRYGQTVMNCLAEVWPKKHKEFLATDLDCFYNDKKADRLLNHLEKIWQHESD